MASTRTIVQIDETLCNGCGDCIPNCHEGALQLIDGKAKLVSDVLCDGIGDCLGHCPEDAITLIQRDAEDFDPVAVAQHLRATESAPSCPSPVSNGTPGPAGRPHGGGCPGSMNRDLRGPGASAPGANPRLHASTGLAGSVGSPSAAYGSRRSDPQPASPQASALGNWPVQLHLLNPNAPFLHDCDLLLAADCVPFAKPDFHGRFLDGHTLAIGCPKLDDVSPYVDKLAMIFRRGVRSLTVLRMEVPCCGGLVQLAARALSEAGVRVPVRVVTIGVRGEVQDDQRVPVE